MPVHPTVLTLRRWRLHVLLLALVFRATAADHSEGHNSHQLVADYSDCIDATRWLGVASDVQACANMCRESKPDAKMFVIRKHGDSDCKCAPNECNSAERVYSAQTAVYEYTSAGQGPSFMICFWGPSSQTSAYKCGTSPNGPLPFILAGFFMLWNFMISQVLLIPLIRIPYFGCGDKQARRMLPMLICPHWAAGLVIPVWQGGWFTTIVAVLFPYTFVSYRIIKLCKAENYHGQLLQIHEDVDLSQNDVLTLRITSVYISDDRLQFTIKGKQLVGGKLKQNGVHPIHLNPDQIAVSNDIVALLSGISTRAVVFPDQEKNTIKLVLTRLRGLVSQDSLEADPLPRRKLSLSQRVLQFSDPKYQFTAVATPHYPDADVDRKLTRLIAKTQQVIPVAVCQVIEQEKPVWP